MINKTVSLLAVVMAIALVSCAPSADKPSLIPWLYKISSNKYLGPAAAKAGEIITIQGRYLGGSVNSTVLFRADELGEGGVPNSAADVVAWDANEIQIKVPDNARPGGGFVFVEVGGVKSNGLPFSVNQ